MIKGRGKKRHVTRVGEIVHISREAVEMRMVARDLVYGFHIGTAIIFVSSFVCIATLCFGSGVNLFGGGKGFLNNDNGVMTLAFAIAALSFLIPPIVLSRQLATARREVEERRRNLTRVANNYQLADVLVPLGDLKCASDMLSADKKSFRALYYVSAIATVWCITLATYFCMHYCKHYDHFSVADKITLLLWSGFFDEGLGYNKIAGEFAVLSLMAIVAVAVVGLVVSKVFGVLYDVKRSYESRSNDEKKKYLASDSDSLPSRSTGKGGAAPQTYCEPGCRSSAKELDAYPHPDAAITDIVALDSPLSPPSYGEINIGTPPPAYTP